MNEPDDEFSFLSDQAHDAGITSEVPRGERINLQLADGRRLSALRYHPPGSQATSPAVTLLHGAGLNAHTWDTTIVALGLPALAIDLPGHGDSSWRKDANYVAETLWPDVAAAMDAWTDGPQLLVGHSLGGLTAAAVAAERTDLVRDLMIVDITPGVSLDEGPSELSAFFAGPTDWATRDELVDRAISFGFGGGSREKVERGVYFNSRIRADGRVEWKHHFAHLAAAMSKTNDEAPEPTAAPLPVASSLGAPGWRDLSGVSAPITLIRGERGYVSDANLAEFRSRVASASIIPMRSGHNPQEEIPRELADQIAKHAIDA
ncbi:alpha/beta hydrolase [Microbacterium sp. NPDC076911]|uniref:alpha/beta fold hydrolase n=1 Tax=Microbacterium sp. NPDC076911 TaxID=3154958 RepID=UPI003415F28A